MAIHLNGWHDFVDEIWSQFAVLNSKVIEGSGVLEAQSLQSKPVHLKLPRKRKTRIRNHISIFIELIHDISDS